MKEIQVKSILVRVRARFELAWVRVTGMSTVEERKQKKKKEREK